MYYYMTPGSAAILLVIFLIFVVICLISEDCNVSDLMKSSPGSAPLY